MKTRIFISDIHVGAKNKHGSQGKYSYDWLSQGEAELLIGFLNYLNNEIKIDEEGMEVILLGDIMDNWVCPHFDKPPSIQDIINANPDIIKALNNLSNNKNIKVYYIKGNHDMDVDQSIFNKKNGLQEIIFIPEGIYNPSDGILAKHGHEHDWFNNPKIFTYNDYPLGYFISRAYATKMANEYCPPKSTVGILYEFMKNNPGLRNEINEYDNKTLIAYIFKLILKYTGLRWTETTFSMPDEKKDIKAVEIIDALNKCDNFPAFKYLSNTNFNFINSAKKESLDKYINVVIFGHTHQVDLFPLDISDDASGNVTGSDYSEVYANCGTWCETPDNKLTYIEIKSYNSNHKISKMQWLGNKVQRLPMDSKFVNDELKVNIL